MRKLGISVATATLALVGVGMAMAPAADASTVKPNACAYEYYFNADGVRIHTQPDTSSTTVGLGYSGQIFSTDDQEENGLFYGEDTSTGVYGWVAGQYISFGYICWT